MIVYAADNGVRQHTFFSRAYFAKASFFLVLAVSDSSVQQKIFNGSLETHSFVIDIIILCRLRQG